MWTWIVGGVVGAGLFAAVVGVVCDRYRARRFGPVRILPKLSPDPPATSSGPKAAVIYYRTKDGRADYGFAIENHGFGYRIYITQQPAYGRRAIDAHSTHRHNDGRFYVCWSGAIATEDQARRIAAVWADRTQEYIRTGRSF